VAPPVPPISCAVIPVTPLQQNCSLLWCTATRRAAVIDPGGDIPRILAAIEKAGVTVEKILLTHGHIDHAGGVVALRAQLPSAVPIEGPHADDAFFLERLDQDGPRYGIEGAAPFVPDRWLQQGDTVTVGEQTLQVLFVPGHSPGSVAFFHEAARFAIVGDVLFAGSIGRTDLPGGDMDTLVASVRDRLWPLGDDVTFLPGHGPASTLGEERRNNPFVGDAALGR
jgi:glyoxylase-like metal-dependent hydrolase (beta-lactamase superfamily II)